MAFFRFIYEDEIKEQFLFYQLLEKTSKGKDIFNLIDNYFSLNDLFLDSCINICTERTSSMSVSVKGFVMLAQKRIQVLFLLIVFQADRFLRQNCKYLNYKRLFYGGYLFEFHDIS